MVNNDSVIEVYLKDLHKLIFANYDTNQITEKLNIIFSFIKKNYVKNELSEKLDNLINIILIPKVIEKKEYSNSFLLKYIKIYMDELSLESEYMLSFIFSKLLKEKSYSKLILYYIIKLLEEPINKDFLLSIEKNLFYEFILKYKVILEDILLNSSTYQLFTDNKLRNNLILYLYEQYKENSGLNIWFPFAGTCIEPMLLSYIFHLICEIDGNEISRFNIIASDHSNNILENGYRSNIFEPIFEKMREDFCKENGISIKDIKTNRKKSNKRIHLENIDFLNASSLPTFSKKFNKKIDIVIINSEKLSIYKNNKKEIGQILKKIQNMGISKILFEIKSEFERDLYRLDYNSINQKKIAVKSFSENEDLNVYYFDLLLNINKIAENNHNPDSFMNIYNNYKNYDKKKFKENLENFNLNSILNEEKLLYGEILVHFGFFSRAYEIIKLNYKYNYTKSLELLKRIESETKNQKLKIIVRNFIKDKRIVEYGFSYDLIDSVLDGIKEYNEQKKEYKNLKWL